MLVPLQIGVNGDSKVFCGVGGRKGGFVYGVVRLDLIRFAAIRNAKHFAFSRVEFHLIYGFPLL